MTCVLPGAVEFHFLSASESRRGTTGTRMYIQGFASGAKFNPVSTGLRIV